MRVAVAARHREGQRHAALPGPVEHAPVARFQAVPGELQAPEAVALVRVGARQIDDEAGLEALLEFIERPLQRVQVVVVAAAIGQVDVEVARPPCGTGNSSGRAVRA